MKYHFTIVNLVTGHVAFDSRKRANFQGYDSEIKAENEAIEKRHLNNLPADSWSIFTFPAGQLEEMSSIRI